MPNYRKPYISFGCLDGMPTKQETILKIINAGWMPDLSGPTPGSAGNFPTFAGNDTLKNLEAALDALGEAGVGAVSILTRTPDALGLIKHAANYKPQMAIGAHDLRDRPHIMERRLAAGLSVAPTPKEAYEAGAKILTAPLGFKQQTYDFFKTKKTDFLASSGLR